MSFGTKNLKGLTPKLWNIFFFKLYTLYHKHRKTLIRVQSMCSSGDTPISAQKEDKGKRVRRREKPGEKSEEREREREQRMSGTALASGLGFGAGIGTGAP